MTITTTAIAFSLSSLGLTFCGIRFFRAFQKMGGVRAGRKIGILLSTLHFLFALMHGVFATGFLFFAEDPEILYRFVLTAHFLLMMIAALGAHLVFYIFFPSVSSWRGTIPIFILGLAFVVLTSITHPRPFIDASGGVDFNFPRELSILLSYLLFIGIGSFFAVFTQSFKQAKSREVQVISFILAALALTGIANILTRFFLPAVFSPYASHFLLTRIFDVTLAFIGIVFISVFVLPPIVIRWLSKTRNPQT